MIAEQIPISNITVNRARFRQATGDIEGLAVSLLKHGQLSPVIVDNNMELLAGFRRLTAAQLNGWSTIWAANKGTLTEVEAREVEMEENLQREQMTWLERANGLAEINRLRQIADPNWGVRNTAALVSTLGGNNKTVHQRDVSNAIKITKMVELFPEIAKAKNISQALTWASAKADSIKRVMDVKDRGEQLTDVSSKILLGDSVQLISTIPDNSFDAVITDPPFGIDYGSRVADTSGSLTAYEDDADAYRRLLSMAPDLYRVIKPNGWLVWFFGMSWYSEVKEAFSAAGFTVDELPIVWNRSNGRTFTNRPDRYFTRGYDVALHAFKGDPKIVIKGRPNVITVDPVASEDRDLLVERPIELYAELIRRLTIPGEIVADFFVGSGSCPAAAASLGRDYFGIELSPERRAVALNKIAANTRQ